MSSTELAALLHGGVVSLAAHATCVLTAPGFVVPAAWNRAERRLDASHLVMMQVLSCRAVERAAVLEAARADLSGFTGIDAASLDDDNLLVAIEALRDAGFVVDGDVELRSDRSIASVRQPPSAAGGDDARTEAPYAMVTTPLAFRPRLGLFGLFDATGVLIDGYTAAQLLALGALRSPTIIDPESVVAGLLPAVEAAGFLRWQPDIEAPATVVQHAARIKRIELARAHEFVMSAQDVHAEHIERLVQRPGRPLVPVYPVAKPVQYPNTALGLIFAYAQAYDGGRLNETYDLEPYWLVRRSNVRKLIEERGPGVFLFSNYIWSMDNNMAISAVVKSVSPESITIHGGPNTPRYPGDNERFLRENPHVDITARNEGEVTVSEILATLDGDLIGPSVRRRMRNVQGIAFLDGDEFVTTADRERVSELDALPSPFLSGVFSAYEPAAPPLVILETNRGCPYGCTFCDWGSATLSRLRKFSLERVFAELDWLAQHKMERVFVADSNFGIFPRDVEIAEHIAYLKETYGYPREFQTSYAKNTIKHLEKIVRVLVDAGITTEGLLSLQSTDDDTLAAVARTNIRTDKYLDLARTFRRERLPLFTDLMIGLPGSTLASFLDDLQFTIDHETVARIFRTEVLVNSPMNEPSYREKYKIETEATDSFELTTMVDKRRKSLMLSTSTLSADDLYREMDIRALYSMCENYGVLRHVARYIRQRAGVREIDFYVALQDHARAHSEDFPTLRWAFDSLVGCAAPPVSWRFFFDDLARYLTEELGLEMDSGLRTVLRVQQALIPDFNRSFPDMVELEHDYAAWFERQMDAKERGVDWCTEVPDLTTFGPITFRVEDSTDLCGQTMGRKMDINYYGHWELNSAVSRAMPTQHLSV